MNKKGYNQREDGAYIPIDTSVIISPTTGRPIKYPESLNNTMKTTKDMFDGSEDYMRFGLDEIKNNVATISFYVDDKLITHTGFISNLLISDIDYSQKKKKPNKDIMDLKVTIILCTAFLATCMLIVNS